MHGYVLKITAFERLRFGLFLILEQLQSPISVVLVRSRVHVWEIGSIPCLRGVGVGCGEGVLARYVF